MVRLNSEFEKLQNSLKKSVKNNNKKPGKKEKGKPVKEKKPLSVKTALKWIGIGILGFIIFLIIISMFMKPSHNSKTKQKQSQHKTIVTTNNSLDNAIDAGKSNNNNKVKQNKSTHPPLLSKEELKNEIDGGVDLTTVKTKPKQQPVKEKKPAPTVKKTAQKKENTQTQTQTQTTVTAQAQIQQPVKPQQPVTVTKKYKTEYFCKNQTPIDNEIVYFVKIDNKMVPVYTLNNWNGKGIVFPKYGIKKVLDKVNFNNNVYYEVEKGKFIINNKKNFVECYSKKVEVK